MLSANTLLDKVRLSFLPPTRLKVSEWAAENITVSTGSGRGSKYDPDFMPYQNEIMNTVIDPSIDKVVVVAAARMGKTFCITNILAYFMAQEPNSILYMRPIDTDIKKFSKEELEALIENTPKLRELVDSKTETYDQKLYPGGTLRLIGSNSSGKLSGYGVLIALMDELDKYHAIPGFGNPCDLAEERTAEYALYGRKIVYISTPTVKDEANKIDWLYEEKSDKRVYRVPCVHCQHEQELIFKNIKFEHCRETLDSIYYECEKCFGHINDSQRLTMMRRGRWVATMPERKGFAGFKINRIYSPLASMQSIVKDFLNKKDNMLMLRQFLNDTLAEAWDENRQVKSSSNVLYQRREHYTSQVPKGVGFLTMSVDVQGNHDTDKCWLEYEVKGWGRDNENWVIEHDLILGSPAEKHVWNVLTEKTKRVYTTYTGLDIGISIVGIDTQGGFTKEVTDYIKGKAPRIIGLDGKKNSPGVPLITRRRNTKINSWEVGTDTAKDSIFAIVNVTKEGPNYCHYPDTLDEEYFLSLLSEQKKTIDGKKKYKPIRDRNEVLDLTVYNWYLYNHVNKFKPTLLLESLKRIDEYVRVEARLEASPEPPETPEGLQATSQPLEPLPISPATPISPVSLPQVEPETARERYLAKLRGTHVATQTAYQGSVWD